jgi:Zn finger protein HypA/HybF involved in hydrogenase expression
MSALSAEIERDRIKEAVETIGKHLASEDSKLWIVKAEIECSDCNRQKEYTAFGSGEIVRVLAKEGWAVMNTDAMICPFCSGHSSGFWE